MFKAMRNRLFAAITALLLLAGPAWPSVLTGWTEIGNATELSNYVELSNSVEIGPFVASGDFDRIGTAGALGFGVGIASTLPDGMSPLDGYDDPTSANYGNYEYADGSVMVYVPIFYYKVGNGSNGLAVNVVDIKGSATYATSTAANAAGYALHRAFIDGGSIHPGFFFDKYEVSKNAKGAGFVGSSIKNGLPISTAADHNPIADLTAATSNNYYQAVNAAHGRDGVDGAVNPASIFTVGTMYQYSALALLSMAHGQAAAGTEFCAWYDATYNFPKGNNNNALADINDATVTFVSDGYSNAAKTGSASDLAKTTHNGQASGITDLNGNLYEIALGLTRDTGNANFYALKESIAAKSMTAGSGGSTDWWGSAASLAATHDVVTADHIPNASAWDRFGNGSNQVLSAATTGNDWLLTGLGLPASQDGQSASGTNLFGTDGLYEYWRAELSPLAGGLWSNGSDAGVWNRYLGLHRTSSGYTVGFRSACYPE